MTFRLLALPIVAALALAQPASAQDAAGDQVRMVIVYGDDEAPLPQGEEIVVVARLPESERYRIPETLRFSDDPANTAWARRVESFEFIGDFGAFSCSPTGAGGFTGCTQELIDAAYGEKREGSALRFGQLIAEARAARLATIDEAAAAEQARVEQIEKEYMERLERERQQALPGEVAPVPADDTPGDAPPIMDDGRAPPPPDE